MSQATTTLLFAFVTLLGIVQVHGETCQKFDYLGFNTHFVSTPPPDDQGVNSPGDIWTWKADMKTNDAAQEKKGDITGFAQRIPAGYWEAVETILFPTGNVFVRYVMPDGDLVYPSAITGGTGDYKNAKGSVTFTNPGGNGTDPWGVDINVCVP